MILACATAATSSTGIRADFAGRRLFVLGKDFHAGMMHLPDEPSYFGLPETITRWP